jgi:cytochrome oxidase Cu insertion factor (SCO1/SenC/PrrC family)
MRTALLALILLFSACGAPAPEGNDTGLAPADPGWVHEGSAAPDFSLVSFKGNSVKLSDYRGRKNVVLVFYRGYW